MTTNVAVIFCLLAAGALRNGAKFSSPDYREREILKELDAEK